MSDAPKSIDLASRSFRARRLRDVALVLPCLGMFAYLSPMLRLFREDTDASGIPPIFLFVYGIWIALIIASMWLSQKLGSTQTD